MNKITLKCKKSYYKEISGVKVALFRKGKWYDIEYISSYVDYKNRHVLELKNEKVYINQDKYFIEPTLAKSLLRDEQIDSILND